MSEKQCPVCYSELDHYYHASEWGIMEDCKSCEICGYVYEFSYGAYQVKVGNALWQWHYNEDQEEIDEIRCEISAAIKEAKTQG